MRAAIIIILLGLISLGSHANAAISNLEVCNKSDSDLDLAVIQTVWSRQFGRFTWEGAGWIHIDKGKCGIIGRSPGTKQAYLSIWARRPGKQSRLLKFPVGDVDSVVGTERVGVREFFCAKRKEAYRIYHRRISDFRRCMVGHDLMVFNVYVQAQGNKSFTLNVK